jgi:hypothetical protein
MAAPVQIIHSTLDGVLDVFNLQVRIAARGEAKPADLRQSGRKRNGPLH